MVFTVTPGGSWERTPRQDSWNKSQELALPQVRVPRTWLPLPLGFRPVLWAPGLGQFPKARSLAWKGLPVSPAVDPADTWRPAEEEDPEVPGRERSSPTYSPSRRKSHRKQERGAAGPGERLAFLRWDLPWG